MNITKKIAGVLAVLFFAGFASASQETNEFILKAIKPTMTGYTNNAFVLTEKVGQEKKDMTTFRRNSETAGPLVAAIGGLVWGGGDMNMEIGEPGKDKVKLSGDAYIAIEAETGFIGNLDFSESTYTFLGRVGLMKHQFASDDKEHLVFKLVKDKGLTYVKGKGTVTLPDGKVLTFPPAGK